MTRKHFLYRARNRDDFLRKIVLFVHVRRQFPWVIVGKFTSRTATTDMYSNANHRASQHRSRFLPIFTLFQSLNFVIRQPFFKPLSSFLCHLLELDFVAQEFTTTSL